MFFLDIGTARIPVNDISFDGSTLKFPMTGYSGDYVGKVSADGNSIVGAWKLEDGTNVPLTFPRATPETAWAIPQPRAGMPAMAADAHPAFEVATIKLSVPVEGGGANAFFSGQGRHFSAKNATLGDLIRYAYTLVPRQIEGEPDWAETTKFDIAGEPDTAGQPSAQQIREMYQELPADRFKLSFRRVHQQLPVYALKVEKDGRKLSRSGNPDGREYVLANPGPHGGGTLTFVNETMAYLVSTLMGYVKDRQVVDQTGLTGRYDFSLTFAPDPLAAGAGTAPDIFHAVQQQLGLRLEPTTAPVEMIVVDHVELPTAN